ncbi:MAG: hypothetical protein DRJ11_02845 [Candidatus Aminicenantes bacterium]|nr:MAG: hypothetical protein DRJ11_02845 [Candidatus Aminicenantes bacterium]
MLAPKKPQPIIIFLFILIIFTLAGCASVQLMENIDNPEPYFAQAYKRIAQVARKDNQQPQKICLLVYERDEARLVRLTAPLGLILGMKDCWAFDDERPAFSHNHWVDKVSEEEWQLIFTRGAGLLLEVLTEDDRVLIWLE